MLRVREYFQRLVQTIGTNWNRFWFVPVHPETICLLRILVGLAACYSVASYTADLSVWFGPDGLLPTDAVRQLSGVSQAGPFDAQPVVARWSYLNYMESRQLLWAAHFTGLAIVAAFTLGLFSRVTSILSLVVVLSYLHRAPMIAGPFEAVLPLLIFCLCWAPTGSCWSIDQWIGRRRVAAGLPGSSARPDEPGGDPSTMANVGQRLLQVHIAALYLLMGTTQLAGQVWWAGESMWWLLARSESRLLDLTWLNQHILLVNAWTHGIVLFEFLFGLLIWNWLARPLLLGLSILLWVPLALVTGQISYCLLMLIANVSFLPADFLRGATRPGPGGAC